MIKIKDKKTGEVWKILEKGDYSRSSKPLGFYQFIVPLKNHSDMWFDNLKEAVTWVGEQIKLRRVNADSPKPASFWD